MRLAGVHAHGDRFAGLRHETGGVARARGLQPTKVWRSCAIRARCRVVAPPGTGAKLNATYVYDIETGLKLFGKTAFWVKAGDEYATFLRKGEAEAYAAANSGAVITFDEAIADFVTEG